MDRMIDSNRRRLLGAAAIAALPGIAAGQDDKYPSRPVRIVNNFAPGGPQDILIRFVSRHLGSELGQSFVIDYMAGSGGNIGATAVANAKPDGYTLLVTLSTTLAINPTVYKNVGFDPLASFSPICLLARFGMVIVANPKTGIKRYEDLAGYAKQNPLLWSSGGNGTPGHVVGAAFAKETGLAMTHVPYRGNAPAALAVVSGEVPLMVSAVAGVLQHIRSGALVPLVFAGEERSPLLPDLITLKEVGIRGVRGSFGHYLMGPKGLSPKVADLVYRESKRALEQPEARNTLTNLDLSPVVMSPAETEKDLEANVSYWSKFLADAKIMAS